MTDRMPARWLYEDGKFLVLVDDALDPKAGDLVSIEKADGSSRPGMLGYKTKTFTAFQYEKTHEYKVGYKRGDTDLITVAGWVDLEKCVTGCEEFTSQYKAMTARDKRKIVGEVYECDKCDRWHIKKKVEW